MIHFDILTLFPNMFPPILETSILGRAVQNKLLSFNYVNIRDFANNKHNKVDDYPYGGGCGMLMQAQPIYEAYESVKNSTGTKPLTVFMSPRGKTFTQQVAREMAQHTHIVLICGHYEGIDQRVIDEIADFELSIGDFVLTGGELASMVICDAVARMVPGVLAVEEGFSNESHFNGLLEYPQYTRPPVWHNRTVPDILLNGNQKEIDAWRTEQALQITEFARPDLFYSDQNIPFCCRNTTEIQQTAVIAGYATENETDVLFKEKRKILQKLAKKSIAVKDCFHIFTKPANFEKFLAENNLPLILLTGEPFFANSISFTQPTCLLSDKNSTDSLYPYQIDKTQSIAVIAEKILEFLSVCNTVKKYSKNT